MMKVCNALCALGLAALSFSAQANCYGTGSYYTCNDASGNSYNVSKYGNSTQVNGYNSSTGSTWNQHSTTVGNTTFQNGNASNGNSWNQTIQSNGGVTNYSGSDSRGRSFNRTCTAYGCN